MKRIILVLNLLLGSISFGYVQQADDMTFTTQFARANNQALPMTQRWDAVVKATELANSSQIKEILDLSKNKDWFMRNAMLVALDKLGNDIVYDKATVLVSDKALVVRSAAVDILTRLNNRKTREVLAKELTKNYNFIGKKSLWIRGQIMRGLVKNPYQSERDYFARLLFDQDDEISNMSMVALEKITRVRFEGQQKLTSWRKLVKEKRWL